MADQITMTASLPVFSPLQSQPKSTISDRVKASAKQTLSDKVIEANPQYRPFGGGFDIDGQQLYVCRVFRYGQILPGKFSNSLQKCSVSHNNRESQFHRFELLVRNRKTKYDWIPVKAPVRKLPENALFGGNRYATQLMMHQSNRKLEKNTATSTDSQLTGFPNNRSGMLLFRGDELNPDFWNHFLTQNIDWSLRKRRLRRAVESKRTRPLLQHTVIARRRGRTRVLESLRRRPLLEMPSSNKNITLTIGEKFMRSDKKDADKEIYNGLFDCSTKGKTESHHILIKPHSIECMREPDSQKLNYYIAKCTLRTGNITSEQIGKVRWLEPANQWMASFPFGGHEIFCLDFSVLALKDS